MITPHDETPVRARTTPLIIGVGNPYRCDDGAGVLAARRVREQRPDVRMVEASGEGASLMETWRSEDWVVLIDAVRAGGTPGRICRLDARRERIPAEFFHYSTHAFSVAEAVEMSRALDALPGRLVIYGIEGKNYAAGRLVSLEVAAAVEEVVNQVLAELSRSADGAVIAPEVSVHA